MAMSSDSAATPAAWIFQSNPARYDIDAYLASSRNIGWLTPQHRQSMQPGQTVYIWRNAGKEKGTAAVIAVGTLTGTPTVLTDEPDAQSFWKGSEEGDKANFRVPIRILRVATPKHEIKAEWLRNDPVCRDLPNLRMAQQTNYPINPAQAQRLARLWSKTGTDFDRADLLLSLRVYAQTFGQPLSESPDSPVAQVALETGRAVSSIYAKVMNFRALDPRSTGAGQSNGGQLTAAVWEEFWNGTEIDLARLNTAIQSLMTPGSEPTSLGQLETEAALVEGYNPEGRRRLVTHYRLERDRRLVEDAKAKWFAENPLLPCCVCGMSFALVYGERGEGFIEAQRNRRQRDRSGTRPASSTTATLRSAAYRPRRWNTSSTASLPSNGSWSAIKSRWTRTAASATTRTTGPKSTSSHATSSTSSSGWFE